MDLGIAGKVAVVTGGSKGIGKAAAIALGREGCKVAVLARGKNSLDRAAEEIGAAGADVLAIRADMTDPGQIELAVRTTISRFGTIHILVNNVGSVGNAGLFEELTDRDWQELFTLNVMSAVRITRLVLPYMKKQSWGRIINIASESGIQPDPFMPHYNVTKAALINLSKSLSKACAPFNILVNTVSPAFIRTPLVEEFMAQTAKAKGITQEEAIRDFLEKNRPNIVLGRPGSSEETAAVVVFLASQQAAFVTGSNYRVDGGSVASL